MVPQAADLFELSDCAVHQDPSEDLVLRVPDLVLQWGTILTAFSLNVLRSAEIGVRISLESLKQQVIPSAAPELL